MVSLQSSTQNRLYFDLNMAQRFKPGELIQKTIDQICEEQSRAQLWESFLSDNASMLEEFFQEYLTNLAYSRLRGSELVLNQSVMELPIPSHTKNILKRQGIEAVRDLVRYSSIELSHLPGFGQKSVVIIEDYLLRVGFRLASISHTITK